MSVRQSPFNKMQLVYSLSCPVLFHIIRWVPFLFLYYCSSLYVSSYIECVILFLFAQGCRNDIKKPSCLISCDRSSPSTGIADVSCHTKGNCDLFGARCPNTGQVGVSCFTTSDSRANGPLYAGCDQADGSLDSFSGFSDPGGRFAITTMRAIGMDSNTSVVLQCRFRAGNHASPVCTSPYLELDGCFASTSPLNMLYPSAK